MFLFVFTVHLCLSTCHVVDVEYRDKIVSDHKYDWFGRNLATSYHKLVIGALNDDNHRGSVMVDEGMRVKGPDDENYFGMHIDVNQQFMLVSDSYSVYVYQSHSPYDMVARFPKDSRVHSLVISDDNTIAVSHYDDNYDNWLTIYQFDGSSTWNIAKKFKLEDMGYSPAVYGDIIAVGVLRASFDRGYVQIFNHVGGEWAKGQTIKQDGVEGFGVSVDIYGQHMAVSTVEGIVFTYMLDQHTNTWINNGKHSVPSVLSQVSIQNDLMVATVNDRKNHPDECGIVYKLTATTSNNNHGDVVWKEFARLTIKGDPMTSRQSNLAVSVEGKFVFTGRVDYRHESVNKVFVHDLSNYNNLLN